MSSEDTPKIDQSVTSHNQSGGVTAHTVNMEPQKAVHGEVLRDNAPEGEEFVTEVLMRLDAAHTAHAFRVEVSGDHPLELDLSGAATPQNAGIMFNVMEFEQGPSRKAIQVGAPLQPAYRAIIRSSRPQAFQIGVGLE
jgi:hypothetical protein